MPTIRLGHTGKHRLPHEQRPASRGRATPKAVNQHMLITILIILAILCAIVFLVRR